MDGKSLLSSLEFRGPSRKDGFDIYEAVYDSSHNPEEHVYSCVAICRKNWKNMEWPALGGTRWINDKRMPGEERSQEDTRHEAIELAMSMYMKNSILRRAADKSIEKLSSHAKERKLFNWQGGKGVIWTPPRAKLTPLRLMCHGRLIEHLKGEYIGSKDLGVGTAELKWISCATHYTIGLGCLKDTGEATAHGVVSGLSTAVRILEKDFGTDSLKGLPILVAGVGKVGFPLVGLLHEAGAEVYIFDRDLKADGEAVVKWCENYEDLTHRKAFDEIFRMGRILSSETAALSLRQIKIISPNGGLAEWLAKPLDGHASRAEVLAENRRNNGNLQLILGAGNDQVSTTTTEEGKKQRDQVLPILANAGILFVPDPLVSPGGVIAVSHELAPKWEADSVNNDTRQIVEKSVEQVFKESERLGRIDAVTMYRAFEKMTEQEWT